MASTINATTSSGIVATADNTGQLQLQTTGTTAVTIDTSQNTTFAGNIIGKQSGISLPYQYYRLNSTVAGANATGAQSILGVGVTLASSTIYEFEGFYVLQKTAGTTSHNVSSSFGGTATLNNIEIMGLSGYSSTLQPSNAPSMGGSAFFITNSTAEIICNQGAISTANNIVPIHVKGTVSVNAGGTFIPQYSLSAAPGGAYTTQIGSYFKIAPIAASGSNVNIGSWS